MELECALAVVGAGAAGLAAARAGGAAEASTIVLEAQQRIGGRILTHDDPVLGVPIELGAEFVHGTPETTLRLLRASGDVLVDTADRAFAFDGRALREAGDPFEIVARALRGAASLREDVSVERYAATLSEEERRFTRLMVEGFDAADPARAGVRAIAEEWSDDENGQTSRSARPGRGYGALTAALCASLDPRYVRVLLGTPVATIRRVSDGVAIDATAPHGEPLVVRARAAIVTLPLGVLQAGSVRFEPALPVETRRALEALVMGPVVKLALRFRRRFWEELDGGRYRDGAFFQHPEARFATFWAPVPRRAPLLMAWAGGPKADALADRSGAERIALALDELRALFGGKADPRAELEAVWTHDWQRDPYARGAYSYVAVGGGDARAALATPVDGVLHFAGEATATSGGGAGTVDGALETGERAAREALAALP